MRRRLVLVAVGLVVGAAGGCVGDGGGGMPLPSALPLSSPVSLSVAPAFAPVVGSGRVVASPASGGGGDEVFVSGDGFPAGERVVITFHGVAVGDGVVDGAGRFERVAVKVPGSLRGVGVQVFIDAGVGPVHARAPFVLTR
ncbi:dihydrolipoamide acetyltransferase [Actinosynnema mirum DSM 43827]|uniref:Dihydrolipoamide acetyltransferase n=1 Tax=Actinosynnema mirum (strain ATCC 29888 / DSM 43827 / JCM 3225 / NBRC 14064 / NCIMB 13271 / NRRL B-12336 / IMRU 3971 / 101) TaxID=446462 RepID=C6WHI1_ACTMD|nr:dihydrolipoamide acetyltransferase [Actinosynnema mirum DSM 43827]